MTYNMLAQTLTRSSRFPSSGPALKWARRSKALLYELAFYAPDVICLQEVDELRWPTYWQPHLRKLGYGGHFNCRSTKLHGVAVLYKEELLALEECHVVDYDTAAGLPLSTDTGNMALLVYLSFKPAFRLQFACLDTHGGIIVGTTHTYWHPHGTYERIRQAHILLKEFQAFETRLQSLYSSRFYTFIAGDFNSDPVLPPYRFLTNKDFHDPLIALEVCQSYDHDYSDAASDVEVPAQHYDASEAALSAFQSLSDWRSSNSIAAVSLYLMGYLQVHPSNVQVKFGEPQFSNWCDGFVALLDYIFVICEVPVRSAQDMEAQCGIRLLELLRMPDEHEMGAGLPQLNTYPSDHLCMIAKVELV